MSDAVVLIVGNAAPVLAGVLGYFRPLDAAKIVGGVLTIGGAVGYASPVQTAKFFGIPFADAHNSLFFPGIGGRNAAAGITALILSFYAERRALGVLLACWTLAGFADIGILMATPGSENVFIHARNIVVLMIISWGLLMH